MAGNFADLDPSKPRPACACAVGECLCEDEADFVWQGKPMCGCCLGDCPDVHPERSAELSRRIAESMEAEKPGSSEGIMRTRVSLVEKD